MTTNKKPTGLMHGDGAQYHYAPEPQHEFDGGLTNRERAVILTIVILVIVALAVLCSTL